jgi:hypothetical protein
MFICKGYNGRGLMMLVSSAMDENKQERKWLIIKHSALR